MANPASPEAMAATIAVAKDEAHFLSSGEPVASAYPQ